MNKTELVEMMQRKTTKLAVLSVVFVGMTVFLVPGLIEEADATFKLKLLQLLAPFLMSVGPCKRDIGLVLLN